MLYSILVVLSVVDCILVVSEIVCLCIIVSMYVGLILSIEQILVEVDVLV